MRILQALIAMFLVTSSVAAHSQTAKIGPSAVWQPTPAFLADAPSACAKSSDSAKCMIDQMTKAGAPVDAVSFSRALGKETHGEFGFMTGFQSQSPVSFAWVSYPMRANNVYGLLLVNGQPPMVNVEDLKLLDAKTMKQGPQFQDLKNQFPNVDIFPGDRDGKTWPNSQTGSDGGTQFVIGYPLRNGCASCAHAGDALFTWNFDAKGKFLGTTFIGMTPAPLK